MPRLRRCMPGCLLIAVTLAGLPAAATAENRDSRARFIVTLTDRSDAMAVAREYAGRGVAVDHVYSSVLQGFAGAMSDAAAAGLLRDGRVRRVERDTTARIDQTQAEATWGLDRTDQRTRPLDR